MALINYVPPDEQSVQDFAAAKAEAIRRMLNAKAQGQSVRAMIHKSHGAATKVYLDGQEVKAPKDGAASERERKTVPEPMLPAGSKRAKRAAAMHGLADETGGH